MKKLYKLTADQDALMPIVRDEWINRVFSGAPMDREAVRAGILWMYDLAKQPRPEFCFVDSPIAAQIAANILSNGTVYSAVRLAVDSAVYSAVSSAVYSAVDSAVYSAVRLAVGSAVYSAVDSAVYSAVSSAVGSAVRSAVRSAVDSAVGSAVGSAVRSAVSSAVGSAVRSAVDSAVGSAVRSAVDSAVDLAVYSAVSSAVRLAVYSAVDSAVGSAVDSAVDSARLRSHYWLGWSGTWFYGLAAYADYYHRIGAIDVPAFHEYRKLLWAHSWDAILLDSGWVVVCECPNYAKTDDQGRPSSLDGPALEWNDGYKLYFINGVRFDDPELYGKVTSGEMPAKDILKIEAIDQRVIALKLRGAERFLDELDARHLHSSDRGNHLYQIDGVFPEKEYFLKYSCPSTGRVYVSCVDREVAAKSKNADHCMAWKHRMTPKQYAAMPLANEA